jgi:hypothetical protein
MHVVRLMDEPNWRSRLSPIEEIFFATSPSAKTLRPNERQPFKERWLVRYIAYDIESFFVAITEVSTVAGYLAGCLDNPAHNPRFADIGYYASFAPLCDCYPCHLQRRRAGTVPIWSSWAACCGHADAAGSTVEARSPSGSGACTRPRAGVRKTTGRPFTDRRGPPGSANKRTPGRLKPKERDSAKRLRLGDRDGEPWPVSPLFRGRKN